MIALRNPEVLLITVAIIQTLRLLEHSLLCSFASERLRGWQLGTTGGIRAFQSICEIAKKIKLEIRTDLKPKWRVKDNSQSFDGNTYSF